MGMEKAKVYFTDLRALPGTNLLKKLERLMRRAGIENIDFEEKLVAIKVHFGEPGNLSFIRPNYAKVVADVVKSLGGKPFLTDCNTLYVGRRKNAIDHIDAAYENGFTPFSTGCQVIIGDGLKGTDDVEVPVEGGELVKTAKIGKAIMDAMFSSASATSRGTNARALAVVSKTWAWAAAAGPARWNSTIRASLRWIPRPAGAAKSVRKTALMAP